MSIATELQDLNDNILDAYTAIGNKGGTVPAQKNTANLDTAIGSIPAAPEAYIPLAVNAISNTLEKPSTSFTWSAPSSASIIGDHALAFAFYRSGVTSVDLSNVTTVNSYGLSNAFYGCSNLTSVDLSNLATVDSQGLEIAFRGCTSLTTMSFDNVSSIDALGFASAFRDCTNLTTVSFPALTTSSFGAYSNQFNTMLQGCSGVTVHFPAAIASIIGPWPSVQNGFGGTNTILRFDL